MEAKGLNDFWGPSQLKHCGASYFPAFPARLSLRTSLISFLLVNVRHSFYKILLCYVCYEDPTEQNKTEWLNIVTARREGLHPGQVFLGTTLFCLTDLGQMEVGNHNSLTFHMTDLLKRCLLRCVFIHLSRRWLYCDFPAKKIFSAVFWKTLLRKLSLEK